MARENKNSVPADVFVAAIKRRLKRDLDFIEMDAPLVADEVCRLIRIEEEQSCVLQLIAPCWPEPKFYFKATRFVGRSLPDGTVPSDTLQERYEVYAIGQLGPVMFRPPLAFFWRRSVESKAEELASRVAEAIARLQALFIYGDQGLSRTEARGIKGPI